MPFWVGAALVVGGAIVHGNHSDYSDWREHSNHRQYGDSEIRRRISEMESRVSSKESAISNLRSKMNSNYNSKISQLKSEKNYSALNNTSAENLVNAVKADMQLELKNSIQRDQQELAEIDLMISRINELEFQSKRE